MHRGLSLIVAVVIVAGCSKSEPAPTEPVPPAVPTEPTPAAPPAAPSSTAKPQATMPSLSTPIVKEPTTTKPPVAPKRDVAKSDAEEEEIPLDKIVSISFEKPSYQFTLAEAAKGVQLKFVIAVRENVGATPKLLDEGGAGSPGRGGLYPFVEIEGGGQYYGLRDVGPGPKGKARPRFVLKKGTYTSPVSWNGVNWRGPSDTNNAKGPPFPPGTYQARVRIAGTLDRHGQKKPYNLQATAEVVLTP